ncbi:MAG: polymerase [Chthoniobacter sp.]|jgi:protein ImuB|nr:polymerase [Chthoniobacter sp.]
MFAAIYVPDFALQCVLRREPELRACALAIVDGGLPARVRQMTPAARERGVAPGMTTTQALGRCPALLFRNADASALASASACLLQCAESFSPWIEATGEGVVTLEWNVRPTCSRPNVGLTCSQPPASEARERPVSVPASLRSPGQTASLPHIEGAHAIVAQLAQCGFTAQVGVAATPDLALLAAHCAQPVLVVEEPGDFLADLPLETLATEGEERPPTPAAAEALAARAEIFRILRRWGLRTLGAFAALPREQVVSRLGGPAAELWDRATGRAVRLLRLVRAPEIFAEAMELEHEVETLEPLLFILRRFIEQLAARLAAAYRVAATLQLRLRFGVGASYEREFRIPAPTGAVEVLFRILETHLDNVRAEAPIVAVELSACATRQEQKQFSLFESGLRDPNKFFETLARLQALLGEGRVGTPVAEDTHRPDAFHLATPRFDDSPAALVAEAPPGPALQRYRPPLPADVQVQAGRPVRVFSEKAFGEITGCRGPWLGSGDWWTGQAWEREEWDVQVGTECYRLAQQGGTWLIEGVYD